MTGHPGASQGGKDDAVARAADLVAREDAEAKVALGRESRVKRGIQIGVAVLAIANILGWVVFPPSGPDATDPRTPAVVERDLRLTVGGAADAIDDWRQRNGGKLPASLAEAGLADATPVEYARVDSSTFEIRAVEGTISVTYRSNVSVADFLATGPRP